MNRLTRAAMIVLAGASVLAGCGPSSAPKPGAQEGVPAEFFQPAGPAEPRAQARMQLPGYRLNFGDELEVIYQVRHDVQNSDYKLQIEDRVNIRFPFQPELNQTLSIPSDGKLTFLLIADPIKSAGLTAAELRGKLDAEYKKVIKNPEFTVVVESANVKVSELKQAITTSPRGQSRLVPVAPDGRLSLPYVSNVLAYGLTIPELIESLNTEYRKAGIEGIEVSVNLLNVAPLKVYVLGEVNRPGLHNVRHHATLTQVIASAGGMLRSRADSTKVLLIRRRGFPVPTGAVLNIRYLTDGLGSQAAANKPVDYAAHRFDPFVQDDDIIFIPSTQLAKNADWIRTVFSESIYRVVPFSSSAGYSVSDSVDWLK
ncbi:MAG: polysaccharide biosynthesis/export family protein [Phycisphaerae bacterium]|nr:polysaccharide biosynthesis/export family protein [Phycisphaerae bacterium]